MTAQRTASAARGGRISSETARRLGILGSLLVKWNPAINLVARDSLANVWARHINDSLQLLPFRTPAARRWLDLGSGAGFPGMVAAIALAETEPDLHVMLAEADLRKAEFLRTVSRETGVDVTVFAERTEFLPPQAADTVSARALAPLPRLCALVHRHLAPGGRAILPKGAHSEAEIAAASKEWRFRLERHASLTDPKGTILVLSDLAHA